LDEKIDTKETILPFRFGLEGFTKEKISCVEKKDFSPSLSHLGDKGGFLGHTAKRIPESPTRFDLSHHIIGVDDAELCFRCSLEGDEGGQVQN
jgi:hypothetical protein